jgi:hypothetical protein
VTKALSKHQRAQWRRLWRRIHERTTISDPAAKHAALIAIEFFGRTGRRIRLSRLRFWKQFGELGADFPFRDDLLVKHKGDDNIPNAPDV